MKLVVFDVETKKAFDEVGGYFPEKLGVSISGVYFRDDEAKVEWYRGYREEEFGEMFKLFESADRIVGFNSISFDVAALSPYYVGNLAKMPHLDIMVEIEKVVGHRIGLDAVAKETLGIQKNGHGLDAIRYFHDGDWKSLEKYCLQDVKVTKELYDFAVKTGKLKFKNRWNNVIVVEVDFGYSDTERAQVQATLF